LALYRESAWEDSQICTHRINRGLQALA